MLCLCLTMFLLQILLNRLFHPFTETYCHGSRAREDLLVRIYNHQFSSQAEHYSLGRQGSDNGDSCSLTLR